MKRNTKLARGITARGITARGFTLIELLVVIGVIGVLISILIPVIGRVHIAAYETSTRSELEQIANACHNYYNDFRAYPGPVSNSDIETGMTAATPLAQPNLSMSPSGPPATNYIVISSQATGVGTGTCLNGAQIGTPAPVSMLFSASENLVLGLLGGLEVSPPGTLAPGQIVFVNNALLPNTPSTLVGTGPKSLVGTNGNPLANKQYTSYMQISFPGSNFLLNGDGSPQQVWSPTTSKSVVPIPAFHDAVGRYFQNSVVPVFTDQFPDALPILYLRSRPGAHGIISGPSDTTYLVSVVDPTMGGIEAHYNYDLRDIEPFTSPSKGNISGTASVTATGPGVPSNGGIILPSPAATPATGQHGLQAVGNGSSATFKLPYYPAPAQPPVTNYPVPTDRVDNAGEYFMNLTVAPTNYTTAPTADYIDATGTPRQKDEFILISAGRDRTYGTGDDITSFGDVQP